MIKPFFVDMNKKFEEFVTKLFRDYYVGEGKVKEQRPQKAWKVDEDMDKKMYPDIIIINRKDEKVTKIIDVKYKPKLYESDLYQIGFYIHEYGMESQEPLDEAFAILPRYSDEKNGEIWSYEQNVLEL